MNDAHKPDELHDEELSQLYRQSRIEEPPMALDSAILSEARKAVATPKRRWRLSAWLMPATATAIALLTATLYIQMRHEHPEAVAPAALEEATPALKRAPASEGAMKDELGQQELRQRKVQGEMKRKSAAPAPSAAPASAPARLAEPSAAGVAAPKQQLERRSNVHDKGVETDRFAPPAEKPATRANKILYPESWLAKIRQLLKQGNKDAARREAEAFRAAYPDQPLPEDIVNALK